VGKAIKAKKSCCKSRERCKRLEKLGYAERQSKRQWSLIVIPPKSVLAAARAR
jgi:hypothetical protein